MKPHTCYNATPAQTFHTFEGDLYSNRTNEKVREKYAHHFAHITSGAQLRATLRAGEVTWPGCYPLFFITSDGAALSFDSVRENLRSVLDSIRTRSNDGWRVVACDVNYEDAQLYCAHSNKRIPSAYAEDEAQG